MAQEQHNGNLSRMAGIAAISAAAGALTAVMLTPKSGRELRSNIKGKAEDAHDKVEDKLDKVTKS